MNVLQKKNIISGLTVLLILSFVMSCNSIFHKRAILLNNEAYATNYREAEDCIEKQRKKNYVIIIQYVCYPYKYRRQLDFVWSIPETGDNKIKLDIFYSPDLSKIRKPLRIKDEYVYHGSLSWLRDIGYDKAWHDKLTFYVQINDAVRNPMETDLWYKNVVGLGLPSIEDVEHFRMDTIRNDFIIGYSELMKDLLIPVMRKYSEELKIPRPDFSNYYLDLDTIR